MGRNIAQFQRFHAVYARVQSVHIAVDRKMLLISRHIVRTEAAIENHALVQVRDFVQLQKHFRCTGTFVLEDLVRMRHV